MTSYSYYLYTYFTYLFLPYFYIIDIHHPLQSFLPPLPLCRSATQTVAVLKNAKWQTKAAIKICIEKFPSRRQGHLSHSSWGQVHSTHSSHSSAATLVSAGELFSLNCVRSLGRSNFFTHPFHAWRFTFSMLIVCSIYCHELVYRQVVNWMKLKMTLLGHLFHPQEFNCWDNRPMYYFNEVRALHCTAGPASAV